ncbi:MAG: hypothetical protein ABIA21_03270, partial [Candidatus Aenigmatarchaeota archaeon]
FLGGIAYLHPVSALRRQYRAKSHDVPSFSEALKVYRDWRKSRRGEEFSLTGCNDFRTYAADHL